MNEVLSTASSRAQGGRSRPHERATQGARGAPQAKGQSVHGRTKAAHMRPARRQAPRGSCSWTDAPSTSDSLLEPTPQAPPRPASCCSTSPRTPRLGRLNSQRTGKWHSRCPRAQLVYKSGTVALKTRARRRFSSTDFLGSAAFPPVLHSIPLGPRLTPLGPGPAKIALGSANVGVRSTNVQGFGSTQFAGFGFGHRRTGTDQSWQRKAGCRSADYVPESGNFGLCDQVMLQAPRLCNARPLLCASCRAGLRASCRCKRMPAKGSRITHKRTTPRPLLSQSLQELMSLHECTWCSL